MAFATAEDVATRLGRDLTATEEDSIVAALDNIDGLIRDEVGKSADWAPDPVPGALVEISIQKVIGLLTNPQGVASYSEELGAAKYSATFRRSQDGGLFFSDQEGRLLRQAVYGSLAGSSSPRSVIDRGIDLREGRDPDEEPA